MQSIIQEMAILLWPRVRGELIERIGEKVMEIVDGDGSEDAAEKLLSPYALGIRDPGALEMVLYPIIYKTDMEKALAKNALADQLKRGKEQAAKAKTELDKMYQQHLKTKNRIDEVNRIIIAAGPDANPDEVVNQITTAIPELKDFNPTHGSLKIYVSAFTNQFFPTFAPVPQPQIAGAMVSWQEYQAKRLADLGFELYKFLAY
ncbi:hypothetical protein DFH07DRAFT_780611 [Mycena maculata]|uniref:Uncharacterized protein n=1 Tax=Mycena maculata TaxID=230809 RepID=A0AAD7I2A2_9AGAR|nr:hypothetical protein DFH07DRAFT_780611 [Mycena maculata]